MNCRRNAPFTPKSSGVYFIKTRASSLRQGDDRTREIGSNVVVWAPPPPPPSGPRARAAFGRPSRSLNPFAPCEQELCHGDQLCWHVVQLSLAGVSIGQLFLPGLSLWWQPKGDFSEFINNSALTGEVLRRQQFSRSPRVRAGSSRVLCFRPRPVPATGSVAVSVLARGGTRPLPTPPLLLRDQGSLHVRLKRVNHQ